MVSPYILALEQPSQSSLGSQRFGQLNRQPAAPGQHLFSRPTTNIGAATVGHRINADIPFRRHPLEGSVRVFEAI